MWLAYVYGAAATVGFLTFLVPRISGIYSLGLFFLVPFVSGLICGFGAYRMDSSSLGPSARRGKPDGFWQGMKMASTAILVFLAGLLAVAWQTSFPPSRGCRCCRSSHCRTYSS